MRSEFGRTTSLHLPPHQLQSALHVSFSVEDGGRQPQAPRRLERELLSRDCLTQSQRTSAIQHCLAVGPFGSDSGNPGIDQRLAGFLPVLRFGLRDHALKVFLKRAFALAIRLKGNLSICSEKA